MKTNYKKAICFIVNIINEELTLNKFNFNT